jgi:hypothetical protein
MINRFLKKRFGSITIVSLALWLGAVLPPLAEAALKVTVINQTGYDLIEVKYVQEKGVNKSLVGMTRQLANGSSHTFDLGKAGAYRVYASFIMGGKKIYAKGNANNLQDGGRYSLTLKKVVFNDSGAGLNFIDQSEFDAIK